MRKYCDNLLCQYFIILKFKRNIMPAHIYIYIYKCLWSKVKVSNQTGRLKKGARTKMTNCEFCLSVLNKPKLLWISYWLFLYIETSDINQRFIISYQRESRICDFNFYFRREICIHIVDSQIKILTVKNILKLE